MTTILAVSTPDGVKMGADSLMVGERKYTHSSAEKITEKNGYFIAGAGEVIARDIIQHIWDPPAPTAADKKNLYKFMIVKVVSSMRKCYTDAEYEWNKLDDEGNMSKGCNFLIAVCGEVFEVRDDFAVLMDDSGVYGIGTGAAYGIGALQVGASLEDALITAAKNDEATAGPFVIKEQFKPKKK